MCVCFVSVCVCALCALCVCVCACVCAVVVSNDANFAVIRNALGKIEVFLTNNVVTKISKCIC